MATYYGSETLYDVVHTVATTATLGESDTLTLYTVPTGYYALIKFAYIERNDETSNGYYGTTEAVIKLVGDDCGNDPFFSMPIGVDLTLNSSDDGVSNESAGWIIHKQWYNSGSISYGSVGASRSYSPFNMYAGPGDIIQIQTSSSIVGNSTTFRYVLDYHIFKQP